MKISKWFTLFFLVVGAVMLASGHPLLQLIAPLCIAGVLPSGAFGDLIGRVGGVVGFKWKGINAVRSYVVPSNPDSADQQIQRARMRQAVFIARQLLATLLKTYWDPFYSTMSGFNAWISQNIMKLAATTYYIDETAIIAKGTLLGVNTLAATYTTGTGAIDGTFVDNTNGTTGLGTDALFVVVIGNDGKVYYSALTGDDRSTESFSITVTSGLTAANVFIYAFFVQGTGASLSVSDNSGVAGA
jgi:Family of unknown function (DUF6266)